ncbi:hypothetical protein T08_1031 [Trichinella sp. T8]|nr:hypothetical protein T08_1031 [Trichinella sp. T8]
MKGGAYKVRTKYPYRSEGQSRLTKKQPVIRNNQDSHFNASHLCPSSGQQANLLIHSCLRLVEKPSKRFCQSSKDQPL